MDGERGGDGRGRGVGGGRARDGRGAEGAGAGRGGAARGGRARAGFVEELGFEPHPGPGGAELDHREEKGVDHRARPGPRPGRCRGRWARSPRGAGAGTAARATAMGKGGACLSRHHLPRCSDAVPGLGSPEIRSPVACRPRGCR